MKLQYWYTSKSSWNKFKAVIFCEAIAMYDNIAGQTTTGTRSRSGTLMIGLATMRTNSFRWLVELIWSRGIDFVTQKSSKMCHALQKVWPTSYTFEEQIGAFLQTDLIDFFEYFKNRVHYFFSNYSNIFRVSATGIVQPTPGLVKISYMKIF